MTNLIIRRIVVLRAWSISVFNTNRFTQLGIYPRVPNAVIQSEVLRQRSFHRRKNRIGCFFALYITVCHGIEHRRHSCLGQGISFQLILNKLVTGNQEIRFSQLPVSLKTCSISFNAIVCKRVRYDFHASIRLRNIISHVLMVLLPIAVPTQTGQVFVKVLAFCKECNLVSLPLRNANKELAVRVLFVFPARGIDVAVKSIRTQTGSEMLIEVVAQESRSILLTEVCTFLVSERSLDVSVALITGVQMVI